ncbi:protein LNK1 isoform X2 [Canna indica]|uniref:Protein LNK1 isoform X2 n=1 Tax=Canna indica TaxID=4628 RepID=A0AAQ3K6D6_9LILI|nr:protein LNK1 isoform X2 [Canna indica]
MNAQTSTGLREGHHIPADKLEENAWNDFANQDDHVLLTQGYEVPNPSAIPCEDIQKSQHEAVFGNYNYAVRNLIPAENGNNSVAKDLNFDEWPDIDNYDDVERMFRSCDTTFGQSHVNFFDELSWLPSSSNAVDDGSRTSYLLPSSEIDLVEEIFADINCLPKFGPQTTDVNSTSVSCHSDSGCRKNAKLEGISVSAQQVGNQNSLEDDIMQRWVDQKVTTGAAVKTQANPLQCFSEESHFFGCSCSSCMHNCNSNAQVDYIVPADWIPQAQSTSNSNKFENDSHPITLYEQFAPHAHQFMDHLKPSVPQVKLPDNKMEKLSKQSYDTALMEHSDQSTETNESSVLKKQIKSQKAIASGNLQEIDGVPIAAIYYRITQQNSLAASVFSDGITVETMSLQQLWHVISQLDVRTKLCIRDSLYRLARSTTQQNIFSGRSCSNESMNVRDILGTEALNICAAGSNVETETNPIDRSMAHLLFQQPLASLKRCS